MSDFDQSGRVWGVILSGIAAGMESPLPIQESMARELITHRKLNTLLQQLASQWRGTGRVKPGLMDLVAEMVRHQ